jgi:hypothetical protein
MKAAYEAALVDVGVTDRNDPITELIAKSIVNVTATGERDPHQVMERALNALGVRRPVAAVSPDSPLAGGSLCPQPARLKAAKISKSGAA